MTPEQKDKLREQSKERQKVMEARVTMLTAKMIERLRPFVEAKHPGDKDDPETQAFEQKMKREAEDLKLESFGVEVCLYGGRPLRFAHLTETTFSFCMPLETCI
jgi:hypothetical protein